MYKLILTSDQRRAIDFVGNRYPEGDDLYYMLLKTKILPEDAAWSFKGDLTFEMPEHVAWQIKDLLQGEDSNYGAALFAPEFRQHLMQFCDSII